MAQVINQAFVDKLKSCSGTEAEAMLANLVSKWANRFEFAELDTSAKSLLGQSLCTILEEPKSEMCRESSLSLMRILSRDKTDIDCWIDERLVRILLDLAGYRQERPPFDQWKLPLEAQKVLCNLTFQSEKARRLCCTLGCLEGLCERLKQTATNPIDNFDRSFFDLRLLFLMTALLADMRQKCRDPPLDALNSLREIFRALIEPAKGSALSEKESELACETLKAAFNLALPFKLAKDLTEDELERFNQWACILRDAMLLTSRKAVQTEDLRSNVVNLLTTLPSSCYQYLTTPVESTHLRVPVYCNRNMEVIQTLLEFLYARLDKPLKEQLESLSPIMTLLTDMARSHENLRKFMRFKVLPPLTDARLRPEEGESFRNKLVRLMTSVMTEIKDLAADYLFELCRRNIGRLIKYTGFGNAAGLLSSQGLMQAAVRGSAAAADGSDDENSDTEEYLRVRDQINPITGCFEEPRPNPMAGMSEEQKEYEATKLLEQIDKLMKQGVVVPGRVGEDGRVHPIEHVLQLQEGTVTRNPNGDNSDEEDVE